MSFNIPAISAADGARHIAVFGGIDLRIPAAETGGILSVWESVAAPDQGPPLHVHDREDELFYVLEGTFQFWCGSETFIGGPGTTAVLPRGVPHTYRNVCRTPGRFLGAAMPGGFEEFFLAVERAGAAAADPDVLTSIAATHGVTFVPPKAANDDTPRRDALEAISDEEQLVTSG
jgi:mannose-6-phosphate isomerase-like protein (cupin superfamily)